MATDTLGLVVNCPKCFRAIWAGAPCGWCARVPVRVWDADGRVRVVRVPVRRADGRR